MRLLFALFALVSLLFFAGCATLSEEQQKALDEWEAAKDATNIQISRVSQQIIDLKGKYEAGELTLAEFTSAISKLYAEKEGLLANKEKIMDSIQGLKEAGVPWYYFLASLFTEAIAIWKMIQYRGATNKLMTAGNSIGSFKMAVADLGDTFINGIAAKKFPKHGQGNKTA